ncbi:MAG: hypothetical protein PHS41_07315, partial [Victivallaceae bacterium]|nr:hypothetical protein [Victivallaceae bacterium]
AEKHSRAFLAVGFQNIYGAEVRTIKQMILSGKYGKLRRISAMGAWSRSDSYYHRNNWAGKQRAADGTAIFDSPVNNAFAHFLNLALFFAGTEETEVGHAVAMQAELVRARPEIETFDSCGIRVLTQNDCRIVVLFTHACEEEQMPELRLELDRMSIVWSQDCRVRCYDPDGKLLSDEPGTDCRVAMCEHMARRIHNDASAVIYTLQNAREHTFCVEKLHELFAVRALTPGEYMILPERDNQYAIPAITALFRKAYLENKLPSEVGAAWSSPSALQRTEA